MLRPSEHILNEQQQAASAHIQAAFGRFQPFLLYGITGSGKTEVYFDAAVAKGAGRGQAGVVSAARNQPHAAAAKRVQARFADVPTAVLHSQTAAGARTQDYLRATLGQAKSDYRHAAGRVYAAGRCGLIVVDEEHDGSFKQENELRYQARDLAVWRAQQAACPIVLGSATPSLESWHKAQSGAYTLLELGARARAAAALPRSGCAGCAPPAARQRLFRAGAETAARQFQARWHVAGVSQPARLFAALFCSDCGHTFGCPRCSAKMVLHRRARQLRCHHCDYRQAVPYKCPDCGNQDLTAVGQGTQRVEETFAHHAAGRAYRARGSRQHRA